MTKQNPYSILRRKPVDDFDDKSQKNGLFKSLGLWQLTAIGVGASSGSESSPWPAW